MLPPNVHKQIYFWSALVMVFGLPLGEFFMSVGTIAFAANWLLEGNVAEKFKSAINQPLVVALLFLYGLHLFGLLWTDDLPFALHDLKIKLPILILPICFASHPIFNSKQMEHILKFFVLSVLISVLISFYTYFQMSSSEAPFDVRDISIFISHIRQSMMVVFSIVLLFYFLKKKQLHATIVVTLSLLFVIYIFVLQALTGLFLLLFTIVVLPIWWKGFKAKSIGMSAVFLMVIAFSAVYFSKDAYTYYFTAKEMPILEQTRQGNAYYHNHKLKQLENGFYVYRNISFKELRNAWKKRTGKDLRTQKEAQLLRYLTSKGLNKDAEGISKLTEKDIENINQGATSALENKGLKQRAYKVAFELSSYLDGQNPSHNSITQRFFAWELGSKMLNDNMWLGLGTGGTKQAYELAYDQSDFNFTKRIRAHNQFLTFLVSFGLIGGFLCLVVLTFPFSSFKTNGLAIMFYSIVFLSFFVEDTLETQPGVLFFTFFIGLFLQKRLLFKQEND